MEEELVFCPNVSDVRQMAVINKTIFFISFVFIVDTNVISLGLLGNS